MIDCVMQDLEGPFHRNKPSWQNNKAVFNEAMKKNLNSAIDKIQKLFEQKTQQSFSDFQQWKRWYIYICSYYIFIDCSRIKGAVLVRLWKRNGRFMYDRLFSRTGSVFYDELYSFHTTFLKTNFFIRSASVKLQILNRTATKLITEVWLIYEIHHIIHFAQWKNNLHVHVRKSSKCELWIEFDFIFGKYFSQMILTHLIVLIFAML